MLTSLSLHKAWITGILLLIGSSLWAQGTTDEQLAAHYYREGEYDKAAIYYERLYDNQPTEDHYGYYFNCLLALEKWKQAEKLAERQIRLHPNVYRYKVDVGKIYIREGDKEKADKYFDKIIKDVSKASVNQILDLGKSFTEIDDTERALGVYYQARKVMGKSYPFHFQIAQVLGQQGDVVGMINEYLDVLEVSTGYLQSVQNTLNRVIGFDEENKYNRVLEEQLMLRVQKNPESDVYARMLIWMLIKQDKFEAAMIQVQALDKRNKEDGERVLELAAKALNSFQYNVAIDGYTYVKAKGPGNYHYEDATIGLLQSQKEKVTNGLYSEASIQKLLTDYDNALQQFGRRASSWEIIRDFAHVKAFFESKYSNKAIEEAVKLLKDGLSLPGLDERSLAHLKMELADIYVLADYIWDASLLYGQVEKRFKYDELGFEAKLKNAKVFFYSGDFGWAEAQLDVLKGSTSKLIANDALELSVFISENTGLDTTTEALSVFAKSELMLAQHKYDSALFLLDLIEKNFPGHELSDNILFQRGMIAEEQGQYADAVGFYLRVKQVYPTDILADNALINAGRIYETALKNTNAAMEVYQEILTDYPGSLFVVEARKRFRSLRGDFMP